MPITPTDPVQHGFVSPCTEIIALSSLMKEFDSVCVKRIFISRADKSNSTPGSKCKTVIYKIHFMVSGKGNISVKFWYFYPLDLTLEEMTMLCLLIVTVRCHWCLNKHTKHLLNDLLWAHVSYNDAVISTLVKIHQLYVS